MGNNNGSWTPYFKSYWIRWSDGSRYDFDVLMGEKVEPRREFIQENAKYVTDLDI